MSIVMLTRLTSPKNDTVLSMQFSVWRKSIAEMTMMAVFICHDDPVKI